MGVAVPLLLNTGVSCRMAFAIRIPLLRAGMGLSCQSAHLDRNDLHVRDVNIIPLGHPQSPQSHLRLTSGRVHADAGRMSEVSGPWFRSPIELLFVV